MNATATMWDALAPAYDTFTGFHDHAAWAAQVDGLAQAAGLAGTRLLDAGCGTGHSSAALRARGYDVTGVDVSPEMLAIAADRLGPDLPLHCHDVRALPRLGAFDVVWSAGDVLNFLLGDGDLEAVFRGFARNLVPGGFAVFDVDTLASFRALYTSLLVFPDAERVVIFEGRERSELAPGAVAEAVVDRLEPAAVPPWWRRERAPHRQRHHPPAAIAAALAAAGLRTVAVWGTDGAGASEQPLDELRHNKAVYIAQLPARREGRR